MQFDNSGGQVNGYVRHMNIFKVNAKVYKSAETIITPDDKEYHVVLNMGEWKMEEIKRMAKKCWIQNTRRIHFHNSKSQRFIV